MSGKRKRLPKLKNVPVLDDIERVHSIIKEYIHDTPVLTSNSLNELLGCEIYFKCENLQKIGAFKMRGALSAALSFSDKELEKGLIAHSSGNHGQGIAKAAQILGVPAYVVMPENSSASKMDAVKGYGAKVITCSNSMKAREETTKKIMDKKGLSFVHPYNDYHVMAGQGTAALEFLKQKSNLHFLLAPVSGGSLLCGSSIVAKELSSKIKVIGCEPLEVNDAERSFYAKKIKTNKSTNTICDGLKANVSEITFPIIAKNVDEIISVKEKTIIKAMQLIWERMNIIVETSSSVPLAVVMENKKYFSGKRVGIILTGGNVDLKKLPF